MEVNETQIPDLGRIHSSAGEKHAYTELERAARGGQAKQGLEGKEQRGDETRVLPEGAPCCGQGSTSSLKKKKKKSHIKQNVRQRDEPHVHGHVGKETKGLAGKGLTW